MQNYKIKVTPETSAEVQELFFELGYSWQVGGNNVRCYLDMKFIYIEDGVIFYRSSSEFVGFDYQEITLSQLRDMVVLKRSDASDATHIQKGDKSNKFYIGHRSYNWEGGWNIVTLDNYDIEKFLIPIKIKEAEPQMKWEDAEKAIKEGKEVQVFVCEWSDIGDVFKNHKFRLKPKTIHIDGGDYTKEELLKIAGEME